MGKYRKGYKLPRQEELKFGLQFLRNIHSETRSDREYLLRTQQITKKLNLNNNHENISNAIVISFSIPITFF